MAKEVLSLRKSANVQAVKEQQSILKAVSMQPSINQTDTNKNSIAIGGDDAIFKTTDNPRTSDDTYDAFGFENSVLGTAPSTSVPPKLPETSRAFSDSEAENAKLEKAAKRAAAQKEKAKLMLELKAIEIKQRLMELEEDETCWVSTRRWGHWYNTQSSTRQASTLLLGGQTSTEQWYSINLDYVHFTTTRPVISSLIRSTDCSADDMLCKNEAKERHLQKADNVYESGALPTELFSMVIGIETACLNTVY
ncbi:uncharacterized protein LTR77_010516 [Saxophila tyrrhenica]|uniref:Uncharacterized protein n=1 Tax=Saxophila tyrrhenica TaxID=1690608 RepID=A0AAV9NUX9_9PEZI|nr:hypothetical protein LTR77_010516 [Saxophila tyrrhenica]